MMKERLHPGEAGFTLIELMVSMVMALVIMAGLFISFSTQNTEYSYQNRRIDSAQDLEFTLKFVAEDLRSALWWAGEIPLITSGGNPTDPTTSLDFWVWDSIASDTAGNVDPTTNRANRLYTWTAAQGGSLRYDRMVQTVDGAGTLLARANAPGEILDSVTFFKVFQDGVTARPAYVPGNPGSGFIDMPPPLAPLAVNDPSGNPVAVPGYTILIEVAVPAGYTKGRMMDVLGNATNNKRIWRYAQIYPMTVVN